jgi:hypothetical protein
MLFNLKFFYIKNLMFFGTTYPINASCEYVFWLYSLTLTTNAIFLNTFLYINNLMRLVITCTIIIMPTSFSTLFSTINN